MRNKILVNGITALRLFSAPFLLRIEPHTVAFLLLYSVCGVSDMADGFLARRLHCRTLFGARLDSLADLIFGFCTAAALLPRFPLPPVLWAGIAAVAVARLCHGVIGCIRYRRFLVFHTTWNRLTGVLVFAVPFVWLWLPTAVFTAYGTVSLAVAALAAGQEGMKIRRGEIHAGE